MVWFFSIFFFICLLLFCGICYADIFHQRREREPEYGEKLIRFLNKLDPYEKFFYNLFGWILALLVIYFIYLG